MKRKVGLSYAITIGENSGPGETSGETFEHIRLFDTDGRWRKMQLSGNRTIFGTGLDVFSKDGTGEDI